MTSIRKDQLIAQILTAICANGYHARLRQDMLYIEPVQQPPKNEKKVEMLISTIKQHFHDVKNFLRAQPWLITCRACQYATTKEDDAFCLCGAKQPWNNMKEQALDKPHYCAQFTLRRAQVSNQT